MKTNLRLLVLLGLMVTLPGLTSFSQVSINTTGNLPDGSAMLDVSATNKGLLVPRVALTGTTDATTIPLPATSLLIYNTATISDVISGFYYNSGTTTVPVWEMVGKAPAVEGGFFYHDKDGDGFGYMYETVWVPDGTDPPAFYVKNNSDCNDNDYYTQDGSPELCDGIDNDCDGLIDEDWPELGQLCLAGEGICQISGFMVCDAANPTGPAICNATPAESSTEEICNYLDDNCNGVVDDPFRNSNGVYDTDGACGNCYTDCRIVFNVPNAHGVCDASGSTPICVMECNPGYYDLDQMPQNGCEFHLQENAVYVSANGEDVPNCGTVFENGTIKACRSISYGINRAFGSGKQSVLVANGLYNETINLIQGIDLLGGYDPVTWSRNLTNSSTVISGTGTIENHPVTINASDITDAELSGFIIYGKEAPVSGKNAYAVYINNSGAGLILRNNSIYAGNAGDGDNGDNGVNGRNGIKGGNGLNTVESYSYTYSFNVSGGNGGVVSLGSITLRGGNGGGVIGQVLNNELQNSGEAGGNAGGLIGGSGGSGGYNRYSTNCSTFISGGFSATGLSGSNGLSGAVGAGGTGGVNVVGIVFNSHWNGVMGTDGQNGYNGSGGGGGGAGGGADVQMNCSGIDDCSGGTGGGGGSGAEGGYGGIRGNPGGGSFCIFIIGGSAPSISNNILYLGHSGDGGTGGFGGVKGSGEAGGEGGQVSGQWAYSMGQGGNGGKGGDGGHGGGGGGGIGGSSFGIFTSGTSGTLNYESINTFSGGTTGKGGKGGLSYGNPGGNGTDGVIMHTSYH